MDSDEDTPKNMQEQDTEQTKNERNDEDNTDEEEENDKINNTSTQSNSSSHSSTIPDLDTMKQYLKDKGINPMDISNEEDGNENENTKEEITNLFRTVRRSLADIHQSSPSTSSKNINQTETTENNDNKNKKQQITQRKTFKFKNEIKFVNKVEYQEPAYVKISKNTSLHLNQKINLINQFHQRMLRNYDEHQKSLIDFVNWGKPITVSAKFNNSLSKAPLGFELSSNEDNSKDTEKEETYVSKTGRVTKKRNYEEDSISSSSRKKHNTTSQSTKKEPNENNNEFNPLRKQQIKPTTNNENLEEGNDTNASINTKRKRKEINVNANNSTTSTPSTSFANAGTSNNAGVGAGVVSSSSSSSSNTPSSSLRLRSNSSAAVAAVAAAASGASGAGGSSPFSLGSSSTSLNQANLPPLVLLSSPHNTRLRGASNFGRGLKTRADKMFDSLKESEDSHKQKIRDKSKFETSLLGFNSSDEDFDESDDNNGNEKTDDDEREKQRGTKTPSRSRNNDNNNSNKNNNSFQSPQSPSSDDQNEEDSKQKYSPASKRRKCNKPLITCPICGKGFRESVINFHASNCR